MERTSENAEHHHQNGHPSSIRLCLSIRRGAHAGDLYGRRPPPLAADAAEVERPHLHLHEGNGELVSLPVVPVNSLQGQARVVLRKVRAADKVEGLRRRGHVSF